MILVVDDQKIVCYSIRRFLQVEGYEVLTAGSGEKALKIVYDKTPDVVIMDVMMPEMDGLAVLEKIKESHPEIQVIMMTAFSTTEKAIQCIKLGAYDYLMKPFDNDELLALVKEALKARALMKEVVTVDGTKDFIGAEKIIGKSPAMLDIYKQIGKVAPTDATVLITGESGTGKELVARAIYHYSKRANKPFLAINCAAIPEQLLEAELFGHERGAFTGADFKKIGKFEQCNGGTVFLDEIGDMSILLQAKLLRVLHDGMFERLGGRETIGTDVRILAATNKNLVDMIKKGLFREDLYYRLNVVSILLPPLRNRKEEIEDLATYFIQKINKKMGTDIKGITAEAIKRLQVYSWPGNVRELENVIQKAMVFCKGEYLTPECCENREPRKDASCATNMEAIQNLVELSFRQGCNERFLDMVRALEQGMVRKAMELTKGNQVHAAKLLGISRNTLRKKLEKDQIAQEQ